MTDNKSTQENEESSGTNDIEATPERDYLLQELVEMTNLSPENTIGVTLQMSGVLVSGVIIAGDEFYQLYAAQIGRPESSIYKMYVSRGDVYKEGRETESAEEQADAIGSVGYIHMKNCTIWQGGIGRGIEVPLWRGRISTIDAFWLGTLGMSNS